MHNAAHPNSTPLWQDCVKADRNWSDGCVACISALGEIGNTSRDIISNVIQHRQCSHHEHGKHKKNTANAVFFLSGAARLLRAALVFASTCIDFDLVALVNEQRHRDREACRDLRWLHDLA